MLNLLRAKIGYCLLRPLSGLPTLSGDTDIYASKMRMKFNILHRILFPSFFSKIGSDDTSIGLLKDAIKDSVPIYVSTDIGQLEYNYFNFLYLDKGLPLAMFANGLTTWQWIPFRAAIPAKIAQLKIKIDNGGELPHPVSSGYIEKLLKDKSSILVRLKTSEIFDDLMWESPEEDVIQKLIEIQQGTETKLTIVPQQFVWSKRPSKMEPGKIRKFFLFFRNYRNRAVVNFCEPISLKTFIDAHPRLSNTELAKILRYSLLEQIRLERKRITGPAIKSKSWFIEHILESDAVQKEAYNLALKKGKDVEDYKLIAERYAKGMIADISHTYIEYSTRILNWAFNNMYDGILADTDGLAKIKNIAKRFPVVFVPNHISHVDYLLLGNLLYENNIAVPYVAAGENLSFWPLGRIFRRCGAFFIKRSFAGNTLYKAVFDSYIKILIQEGYCQEFFIEGGRSRTGKLRKPKYGMLSTIVDAMQDGAAKDIYFVPASITYDKVIEEGSYVKESEGAEKEKEKRTDILKLHRFLKHRHGKIYLNFGEPVSFNEVRSRIDTNLPTEQIKSRLTESIASRIMYSLGRRSVVTPFALTAAAILIEDKRGITSERLYQNAEALKSYLEFAGVHIAETLKEDHNRSINEAVQQLEDQKIILSHKDFLPVYYSVPEDKRPHLNFQKNAIKTHLLPIAYASASILALFKKRGTTMFTVDDFDVEVEYLRGLFSYEFSSHRNLISNQALETALGYLAKTNFIKLDGLAKEITITAEGMDGLRTFSSLISALRETYKTAFYTCMQLKKNETTDEKTLNRQMMKSGHHLLNLGQITRYESISRHTFENAISLFKAIGFLKEVPSEEHNKNVPMYRWRHSNAALKELQQELELFC